MYLVTKLFSYTPYGPSDKNEWAGHTFCSKRFLCPIPAGTALPCFQGQFAAHWAESAFMPPAGAVLILPGGRFTAINTENIGRRIIAWKNADKNMKM